MTTERNYDFVRTYKLTTITVSSWTSYGHCKQNTENKLYLVKTISANLRGVYEVASSYPNANITFA